MTTVSTQTPDPEVGVPTTTGVFKLSDGRVVRRTELSTGVVIETDVFAADYEPVTGEPNDAGEIEMCPVSKQAPIAPPSR